MIQNNRDESELAEHSLHLIELSDCSSSWEDENFE